MFDSQTERTDLGDLLELMEELVGHPPCSNFPEAFFPEQGQQAPGDIRMAKEMCSACPIRLECLQFAVQHPQRGIWGGLTQNERRRLKKLNNAK